MAEQVNQLLDTIKSATCSICDNVLSVPPVMIISEDGLKNRCGRCRRVECKFLMRNVTFENSAKFLSFPCTYKKCKEKILWGRVEEHENVCPFRTIHCPAYDCDLELEERNLLAHFKESHLDYIRYQSIEMSFPVSDVYLLIVSGMRFLVYFLTRSRSFIISVLSLQHSEKRMQYNVELSSDTVPGFSLSHKNSNIKRYDQNKYCFLCTHSDCCVRSHKKIDFAEISSSDFSRKSALHLLEIPKGDTCKVTVTVNEASTKRKSQSELTDSQLQKNKMLRLNFECPICNEYMTGSGIFMCKVGHVICQACKTRVKNCPSCKAEITTRNYVLEELTSLVDLACHNDYKGCAFRGNVPEVKKHEAKCVLRSSSGSR